MTIQRNMSLNLIHQIVEQEATPVSTHLATTTTHSGKCNGQQLHHLDTTDMEEQFPVQ